MSFAACEQSAKLNPFIGGYGFRDLCKSACDRKDYETALECQLLAKKYDEDAGNEAMGCLIISQAKNSNFLEVANKLISQSIALIDEDREYGLQALMKIAKKFANLQKYEEAMQCTQLAKTLGDSRDCTRERRPLLDILPFNKMSEHMLKLKQYKLAEEYARKSEDRFGATSWLFTHILIKQMKEENFLNEALLAEMPPNPNTESGVTAIEAVVFFLIDKGRLDEAQKFAKIRGLLQLDIDQDFKLELEKKLAKSGIDVNAWLS